MAAISKKQGSLGKGNSTRMELLMFIGGMGMLAHSHATFLPIVQKNFNKIAEEKDKHFNFLKYVILAVPNEQALSISYQDSN